MCFLASEIILLFSFHYAFFWFRAVNEADYKIRLLCKFILSIFYQYLCLILLYCISVVFKTIFWAPVRLLVQNVCRGVQSLISVADSIYCYFV